jgi:hypothetical protein
MGTRRWRPLWGFGQRRHESRTSRSTPRFFAEVKELSGLQPAAPPQGGPRVATARPRSTCSRISCRAPGRPFRMDPERAGAEAPRPPAVSTSREGRRREEPRCDPTSRKQPGEPGALRGCDAVVSDVAEVTRAVFRRGCRPGLTTQARDVNPDVAGIGRNRRTGPHLPRPQRPHEAGCDRDARGTDVPRTSKALMPILVRTRNRNSTPQCTFFVHLVMHNPSPRLSTGVSRGLFLDTAYGARQKRLVRMFL